jgi:ribosome recycling factor
MDADEILMEAEEKMEAAVGHLTAELQGMRSGRASPALVDRLRVNAYETQTPLGQLAQIGCPEPRMILVKPYDASILKNIEKAIQSSDLGLNPTSDGKVIRIVLPPLSEERRRQLAKVVKEHGEAAAIAIRNARRDSNKKADSALDDGDLTEDQAQDLKESIQDLTKQYEERAKSVVEKKTSELMEV